MGTLEDGRKDKPYHQLMVDFIEQIGQTECPAAVSEVQALEADCGDSIGARLVGQVLERDGEWHIYLIRIDKQGPYRMWRRKWRSFSSRPMADIVARYRTELLSDRQCAWHAGSSILSWN